MFTLLKHYRQQFDVCRAEIEFERISGGEPAEGGVFERLGLGGGGGFAVDERQVDRAVGIGVGNRRAYLRIDDRKRDLLHALAGKGLFGRLAGFDLTSDEFPPPALRLAKRTLAEKILVPTADDSAYDFYNSRIVAHANGIIPNLAQKWDAHRRHRHQHFPPHQGTPIGA